MPWREHSVPGSARAARAEVGAGLAPRPPHPCRQRWLRAGLRRGVRAGGGEGGSEPGRAREPGPAPSAALTSAPSAPFLPACLGLPAAACPPNAGAAAGPGLPRARPGLLPRPLIHGDHSSPVSSAALLPSARPRQPPPCSHTGCSVARTGHWLGAAELGPAWGARPPWVPCSSHLEVPVHVEPWAGAWQGRKDSEAKGRGLLPCPPRSTRTLGRGRNPEPCLPLKSAVFQGSPAPTTAS